MSEDAFRRLTCDIAPFGVRIPADLKRRVSEAARANQRSVNAEIVAALQEKYPAPKELVDVRPVVAWSVWVNQASDEDEVRRRETFFWKVIKAAETTGILPPPPID